MAFTLTTLKSAIQDYLQTTETTFVNNLDTIITQAEDRILKSVQLPDFRINRTGTLTASNQYLSTPTDFLAPYSLAVDNSGYEFLIFKDVNSLERRIPAQQQQVSLSITRSLMMIRLLLDQHQTPGLRLSCTIFISQNLLPPRRAGLAG